MFDFSVFNSGFVIAGLVSFLVCALIVTTQRWHGALSLDRHLCGKQKFHKVPVPRVGGVPLMLGLISAFIWSYTQTSDVAKKDEMLRGLALLGSALPVFIIGFIEDLAKNLSVRLRFGAAVFSALLACWSLNAILPRVDLPVIDNLLDLLPVAVLITAIAVTGVINSINIIDGFNGIAGWTVISILLGISFLAIQFDDAFVLELALLGAGATLGFLFLNYPRGRLFMGDGGAYLLGFWCAELAVLTVYRHPEISAWQVLALYAYPVIEVLFSIFRKKVLRKMSATKPDRLHLHMLIYRRCICRLVPRDDRRPWLRNAAVCWLIAPWMMSWTILVVTLGAEGANAALLVSFQVAVYLMVYVRLLRGRWYFRPLAFFRLMRAGRPRKI